MLSDRGSAIRDFCEDEAVVVADALGRQAARRLFDRAASAPGVALRRLPFVGSRLEKALPDPATTPAPLLLPGDGAPNFLFASPREVLDAVAPPLNRDDELYALDVTKLLEDAAPDDEARATLETLLGGGAAPRGPSRPRGRFWTSRRPRRKSRTTGASTRCWTPPRRRSDGGTRTPSRSCTSRRSSTTRSARRCATARAASRRAWRSASGGGSSCALLAIDAPVVD